MNQTPHDQGPQCLVGGPNAKRQRLETAGIPLPCESGFRKPNAARPLFADGVADGVAAPPPKPPQPPSVKQQRRALLKKKREAKGRIEEEE